MSHSIPIDQGAARLGDLIRALVPGDEIIVTDHDQPIARILPTTPMPAPHVGGSWKGKVEMLDDDDEVIAEHFKEYLP